MSAKHIDTIVTAAERMVNEISHLRAVANIVASLSPEIAQATIKSADRMTERLCEILEAIRSDGDEYTDMLRSFVGVRP